MFPHAVDKRVSFVRQASCVERENADRQRKARDQVDEHHVLGAEAACKNRPARSLGNAAKERCRVAGTLLERHSSSGGSPPAEALARRRKSGSGLSVVL